MPLRRRADPHAPAQYLSQAVGSHRDAHSLALAALLVFSLNISAQDTLTKIAKQYRGNTITVALEFSKKNRNPMMRALAAAGAIDPNGHATGFFVGEGLVMTSMSMFPVQIPNEQMVDFKVLVPGDAEAELEAQFQGRDERSSVAFVKTKEKQNWPAVAFVLPTESTMPRPLARFSRWRVMTNRA